MNERERSADQVASLDRGEPIDLAGAPPPNLDSAGEDVCPTCGGSGFLDAGARCADCGGTGTISEPVAGNE